MTKRPGLAIDTDSPSKTYRPRNRPPVQAVQRVTLSVKAGEAVALVGPAGVRKMTTIKMIAGLIKPTAWPVRVRGQDLAHERDAVRRLIGVLLGDSLSNSAGHGTVSLR